MSHDDGLLFLLGVVLVLHVACAVYVGVSLAEREWVHVANGSMIGLLAVLSLLYVIRALYV